MNLSAIHLNAQDVRTIFLVFLVFVIFATRMTKGTAKETPEGLTFAMKPAVTWVRYLFLPVYLAVLFYPVYTHQRNMPAWVIGVLILVLGFLLYQMPGTIVLTSNAIVQHYWLRADKTIQYPEVMAIQAAAQGQTRVLGDNRTTITHTISHADSARFRAELAQRTNKTLT
jgi:hypothetical protein